MYRLPGSGRPSKVTPAIKQIVEDKMQEDDETTAVQLFHLLKSKGHPLSLATILRCRYSLGWTFRGSSYCQLIRHPNKVKRVDWAKANEHTTFEDVVWTDESSFQLETHRRFCCRKKGEPPKNKPRYTVQSPLHAYIHSHSPHYMHTFTQSPLHAYIHTVPTTCIHSHSPHYMHTFTHSPLHAYIHTVPTTCIHSHSPHYMHTFTQSPLHAYIHTVPTTCIHSHSPHYMHTFTQSPLHAYIHTVPTTCIHSHSPHYMHTFTQSPLHAYIHTVPTTCIHSHSPHYMHTYTSHMIHTLIIIHLLLFLGQSIL